MMGEEPSPSRPKAKKLPFKPTALRKSASQRLATPSDDTNIDDGLDLFRRSKEMEPIVAADRERRMKKKMKQKQEEEARRKSDESAKRPLDDDEEIDTQAATGPHESPWVARRSTPVGGCSSRDGDVMARTSNPTPIVLVDSDDDDGGDVQVARSTKQREASVEVHETSFMATEEEDEFSEYVRRAEEQRARDQAMLSVGEDGEAIKDRIEILVTSVVPGTKPCCFKFLFDKQLRLARNTWLTLQHHKGILKDVQKEDDIVLTWRRQRVYTFSTLLTLGIRPQGNGRAVVDGNGSKGLADGRTRVHMEAWTLDLFHEMEREEELRRKRGAGELSDEDDRAAAEEAPAPEVKIRVILKSRDLEDVNLTVRPETTVETLITGFRTQRSIGSDKDVGLWFDGDRLEEHVTMDEAEIDDMDTFEVHIR
ncbi:hypothetical protein MAC_03766 [Metarhizium acridum CQMa 102]|uniref:Ubiquitin-like domain-containing protein n=1 Tax=Metarhizium acridum (strain CQMa 102) TaxID=655827 RepID=E9E1L8_METAQ|nr:uncharacterized protein MAC_03766 [Metarhizium acridum CQMa 102]EFY90251.1 hypothetical protein MAC_03766 [Metarhizium acridum CQMa 102]